MNTPALSKKQQQKKLSAKKGLRNVLAQPYEKYWPVLDKDEESGLKDSLNRLLPELRRKAKPLKWKYTPNVSKKQQRAAPVSTEMETEADSAENCYRKAVAMGVNAVTRDLEKNNISSVLLDSTVESLMIKHVVAMAQNKGIPILLVSFLKNTTLENIGFACAAMGIKNGGAKDVHPFHEVHQEIVRCSPLVSSVKKALNESSTVTDRDSHEDDEMSEDGETSEDDKMSENGGTSEDDKMTEDDKNSPPEDENSPPKDSPFVLSTDVYKYRSTRNERTFVPPGTAEKEANDREWSEFIAVEKDDIQMDVGKALNPRKKQRYMDIHAEDDERSPKAPRTGEQKASKHPGKNKNATYLPLKVKRVQGNVNRLKAGKQIKSSNKS